MKIIARFSCLIILALITAFPAFYISSLKSEKKSLILAGDEVILPDENLIVRVEKEVGETGYYLMSNRKVYKVHDFLLIKPGPSESYEEKKDRMLFMFLALILLVFGVILFRGAHIIRYISR